MANRRPTYNLEEGSLHEQFINSRAKIRLFGGGYGNGKTAGMVILALTLAEAYPGSNGLIARGTYPKLNDTIRKEFIKWCPKGWIKSFPLSQGSNNTCTMHNGTEVSFRYMAQQGKNTDTGDTTSNLLSATYDWIIVDQIEDPEFSYKDFIDLLGRLRGNAPCVSDDMSMPRSGPRWLALSCNPTRNWVYHKLVKPLKLYEKTGRITDDLIWDEEKQAPMIELFEGSTYTNKANLEPDFIRTLEATYSGSMRERFLEGKWAAYEGLVYPTWDGSEQMIPYDEMHHLFLRTQNDYRRNVIPFEGYDYGLAAPACYGFWFMDVDGNVHLLDGFYEKELPLIGPSGTDNQVARIEEIRARYLPMLGIDSRDLWIDADPAVMKRAASGKSGVTGESVSWIVHQGTNGRVRFRSGNNDIMNGITKVNSYMVPMPKHNHPYTGSRPAPRLYISDRCDWFDDEASAYRWNKSRFDQNEDKPIDKDDHALDMAKYALSYKPHAPTFKDDKLMFANRRTIWYEPPDTRDDRPKARHM